MILRISPELARIHAHICADGCIYRLKTRRSQKELLSHKRKNIWRNRFHMRYYNNDPDLLSIFASDINSEFLRNIHPNFKSRIVDVQGKHIYDLLKYLGAGKSYEWSISPLIIKSRVEIIETWLRALYDDEAHVSEKEKRIVLNMVNKPGLDVVCTLLERINIKTKVNGPYVNKTCFSYQLKIYKKDLKIFQTRVGFNSKKKKLALARIISGDAAI